jgi:hypothetical protein
MDDPQVGLDVVAALVKRTKVGHGPHRNDASSSFPGARVSGSTRASPTCCRQASEGGLRQQRAAACAQCLGNVMRALEIPGDQERSRGIAGNDPGEQPIVPRLPDLLVGPIGLGGEKAAGTTLGNSEMQGGTARPVALVDLERPKGAMQLEPSRRLDLPGPQQRLHLVRKRLRHRKGTRLDEPDEHLAHQILSLLFGRVLVPQQRQEVR